MNNIAAMTWGDFLAVAYRLGVSVRDDGGVKHLYRRADGVDLWHPLPARFGDRERIGTQRFFHVCRDLELDDRTHFRDWLLVL